MSDEPAEKILVDRGYVLAAYLEVDRSDLDESGYRENEYHLGRQQEYLILTDEEADEAAEEYIEESLWAFQADFLSAYINRLRPEHIRKIQELYEDANEPIQALVGDRFDELVQDAIASDGRGHFLSPYDGEENEVWPDSDEIKQAITEMLRQEQDTGEEEGDFEPLDPEWEYDFEPELLLVYRLN